MRIIISWLTLLLLPFFLKDKPIAPTQKSETAVYINKEFNYKLKYPTLLTDYKIQEKSKKGITLKSSDDIILKVYGSRSMNDKDTDELCDAIIEEHIDSLAGTRLLYKIVTRDYCEASYLSTNYRYYDKITHQGSKIVKMRIMIPIEDSIKINLLKRSIKLQLNAMT